MLPKTGKPSLRSQEFYARVFRPSYELFRNAARQTPLVIMLWGPRQRTREWSNKRLQIHEELCRLGHTVFFSEQLGVPVAAVSKKGVAFLQSEMADLVIGMQSSYSVVGTVHHFVGFHVVDAKMLLFIDEAAPDAHLYQRALTELNTYYDNVETYKYPEDITKDNLLKKVISKVGVMQMVKYCAIQKAQSWGLRLDDLDTAPASSGAIPQPFRYNLLELYREHHDEIAVLTDSTTLFILAYVNRTGGTTLKTLSHHLGLAEDALQQKMVPLQRSEMMVSSQGMLTTTGFGKRVLDGVGLGAPAMLAAPPRPLVTKQEKMVPLAKGIGFSFAATVLLILVALYWSFIVQNQLPLAYTPTHPASTATQTYTRTPMITPPSPIRR